MEQRSWTPADLLQLAGGYWSACALHAGVKLDVFTALSAGSRTAAEVAGEIHADVRGTGILLDALCALGLLDKGDGTYRATPFAADHLSRSSDSYLGHIILHHHHLVEGWSKIDQAVTRGGPVGERMSHGPDESVRESFLMGMFNLAMQLAPRIVPAINLTGKKRLLDLGGGPGTYAIQFCLHNPHLQAVIFDLPSTRSFAESTVARFGLSGRITFAGGDFITDQIPGRFDTAWLSHILHSEGPEGCATVLAKAVSAVEPGGAVFVQEFVMNDAMDGPEFPALFSLNMLIGTPEGRSYSGNQLKEMLMQAGLTEVQRLAIDLPNGAGVFSAIKPA